MRPVEDEYGDPVLRGACPSCGGDVAFSDTCHTWGGKEDGTGWMACMGCFSALYLFCCEPGCDWRYTHGLNPLNPRSAANAKNRPPWLEEAREWLDGAIS